MVNGNVRPFLSELIDLRFSAWGEPVIGVSIAIGDIALALFLSGYDVLDVLWESSHLAVSYETEGDPFPRHGGSYSVVC